MSKDCCKNKCDLCPEKAELYLKIVAEFRTTRSGYFCYPETAHKKALEALKEMKCKC